MITVILLILLNSLALGLIIKLLLLLFKLKIAFWIIICGCWGVFGVITILAYTNFISSLMILHAHLRTPLIEEEQRLNSLLEMAVSRIYNNSNKIFSRLGNLKFAIINSQILEDYVIGKNIIAISNGAMNILNDDQLEALIAHRLTCLYFSYGLQYNALRLNIWLFDKVTLILGIFRISKIFNISRISGIGKIFAIMFLLFVNILFVIILPLLVLCWLIDKINQLLITLWTKYSNYCVDKIIFNAGYQQSLIELLDIMNNFGATKIAHKFFEGYLVSLHSPISRIARLTNTK